MTDKKNLADLSRLQPKVFEHFCHILRSEQLGHAYLLVGQFASLEMALMLSQAIFCQRAVDKLPCQDCRSCRLIATDTFTDVKRLAPINNVIKTDRVREVLRNFSQSGFESEQQVLIIEGADKLHPNAANRLLKFIEEPQSPIRVFLLTDQETTVLPTIKSRCQVFYFPKNHQLMVEELEASGLLKDQAHLLADLATDLPHALALANSTTFKRQLPLAKRWVSQYLAGDRAVYLTTAQLASLPEDKAAQEELLQLLTLLMGKDVRLSKAQQGLASLLLAKRMWQVNVSLQNVLEYVILSSCDERYLYG